MHHPFQPVKASPYIELSPVSSSASSAHGVSAVLVVAEVVSLVNTNKRLSQTRIKFQILACRL